MPNHNYGTNRIREDGTRASRPYPEQDEPELVVAHNVEHAVGRGGPGFAHLHVHTEYSSLDGLGKVAQYVEVAKQHGMTHLGITDHGVVSGHPEFYKECRKAGIEPVLGEEFYFVEDVDWRPPKGSKDTDERAHFTCLAIGEPGYKVLAELSTEAHRNFYSKPIVDRNILESLGDDARHLMVFSGCAASMISRAILDDNEGEAIERTLWWRETFPNFYIEHMHHDTEFDVKLNMGLQALAQRYSIPWVITNDPHYVVPEDDCHHDALLAIGTAADIDDPGRFRFDGTGYHLRSRQELKDVFVRNYGQQVWKPGAAETMRIARACEVHIPAWDTRMWQFPSYARARGDSFGLLERLTYKALSKKDFAEDPEYIDRVDFELGVFKDINVGEVGMADFLLITRWCIRKALAGGMHPEWGPIPVGPGRGSVCGSLVCMLLGIHKMDSIRYGLRFDRFLNPARPKMPDVDTDFGQMRRDEMFEVVANEFGAENVVRVGAHQNMKVKAAFQSLARAYGISFPDRIKISKELSDDEEDEYALPEAIREGYPELFAQLSRLAGTKKGISKHAAGVVIADPSLNVRSLMPELWIASTKSWVGQYDLGAVEDLGLLKQDFLGLRTLDTIAEAIRIIEETTGEALDPDSWWPDHEEDDDKAYAMLADGGCAGVFQMEGPTNTRGIQEIGPVCFEDIVSCTSLYRTGALSAGFDKIFLENRKHEVADIPYVHPGLKPILEPTWGVVLYQEQIMDMAEDLAGFDGSQLADIIEAIKHKKGPLMQSMKPTFIQGCIDTVNMKSSVAKKIWHMIEGYSGYGYNRSHAVAYSFTTYQTARLKALWPKQYMTAMLCTVDTGSKEGKEKRQRYMRGALSAGLKIRPPCINRGRAKASLSTNLRSLRMGYTEIKGIGTATAIRIESVRPEGGFESIDQVKKLLAPGVVEKLSKAGALAIFDVETTRDQQEEMLDWQFVDGMRRWRERYSDVIELPDDLGTDQPTVCVVGEIISLSRAKTKTGKDYATWKIRHSPTEIYSVRLWSETKSHWSYPPGSVVMVSGSYEGKWNNISLGDHRAIKLLKRKE